MTHVVRHLRRVTSPCSSDASTDGQLLERFLTAHDEEAFAAILRRHGPMVLGVCRRVLARVHDAEDAFQATFLVLVCKGRSITARESVASWLYGVAYRTAQKARAAAVLRRAKERKMARPEALARPDDRWDELRPLIDQELSKLPETYRAAILLCDLQGQTRKQAARQLGCPEGTIAGRLARARAMLAGRLARRGLAVSCGALAAALAHGEASACVRPPLVASTIKAATLVAAGHAAAGAVGHSAAVLTEGVLKSMGISKLKVVLTAALAVALLGAGWAIYHTSAADQPRQGQGKPAPAIGAPAAGGQVAGRPAIGAPAGGASVKGDEKVNLPQGAPPTQVLASIDKDGKLVIKRATYMRFPGFNVPGGPGGAPVPLPAPGGAVNPAVPAPPPPGAEKFAPGSRVNPAPPATLPGAPGGGAGGGAPGAAGGAAPGAPGAAGGGAAPGIPGFPAGAPGGGVQVFPGLGGGGIGRPAIAPLPPGQLVVHLQAQTYDLDNVQVLDTSGKKLDKKTVLARLKKETVAMATYNQALDPLHLRVLKDDILTFVLPVQRFPGIPGGPLPGIPVPQPAPLPPAGAGGAGPAGFGVAQPGITVPAVPVAPPPEKNSK